MLPNHHISILQMVIHASAQPQMIRFKTCYVRSANIANNRNLIWQGFEESKADYLFMVDDDMTFEPVALLMLIALSLIHDKCVATGIARKGSPPYDYAIFQEGKALTEIPDTVFQAKGVGAFGMLIPKSVIDKLPIHPFLRTDGYEEDLSFCLRLDEAKVPIFCDPSIVFEHWRPFPVKPL